MEIKVIKNEKEYQEALSEIEQLMDAAPGSSEEERLEVLSILVEKYEKENYPIDLPDPIEAIKFRMEQEGLSHKDMQKYLGSQSKVSEVLNYKRPLSLPMIRSLNEGLGIPAEVLLHETGKQIPEKKFSINDYPFTEMFNRNYFKGFQGNLYKAKEFSEGLLTEFFSVFRGMESDRVYCRYSDKEVDQNAILAWQAMAIHDLQAEEIGEYNKELLNEEFLQGFKYLCNLSDGPGLVKEYLNKKGIHFLALKHLPKTYLDGACFTSPHGNPIIGLTLRYDRLDNFWFTLAHEIGHLYLHLENGEKSFFDDTQKDVNKIEDDLELEADRFANETLIPPEKWNSINSDALTVTDSEDIVSLAESVSISPAIVAGRVRWETGNFALFTDLLGNGNLRPQFFE